jgi:F420-dependent oxidoreductase-like protein
MAIRLGVGLHHSRDLLGAVDAAVAAEDLGYESAWIPEAYGSDAVTVLGFIAARTSSISLGTGILQMVARTPTNTAMTAMTLDELSGGRVVLGLGVSGPQVVEGWHGESFDKPLARTREYVEIIRTVVRREAPLTYAGKVYNIPRNPESPFPALKSSMHPIRPAIPIYLAANGPKNLALTAEIADGWLPSLYCPEQADQVGEQLEVGLAKRDPALQPLKIATNVQAFVGDDIDACRDLARPYLALYIGGMGSRERNFYKDVVTRFGYGEAADVVQDLYLSGRQKEAAAAVPDELVDKLALVGPEGAVRDRLKVWDDSGVDRLMIKTSDIATLETIRRLADEL